MKLIPVLLLLACQTAFSQLRLPELSQRSVTTQDFGYTTITVQYGRPEARGRRIFGELTPYGRLWRTGAGKSTWLTFSTEVFINDKRVPPGSYALVTIPGEEEWTVMLNSDTSTLYGDPSEYDVKKEAARVIVKPGKAGHYYELLTIYLDSRQYDAELYLAWENTQIHFPIVTRSHQKAKKLIEDELRAHPNDVNVLAEASYYYSMNNESPEQILRWLDRALSIEETHWVYLQKIELLERTKNYTEARRTALKAIDFLKREKPDGDAWVDRVSHIEGKLKSWPN